MLHPAEEYVDALVTCELSMMMALKYKEDPNPCVRVCSALQSLKCNNRLNSEVFRGVSKSETPSAMIYHFRTMLDEMIST